MNVKPLNLNILAIKLTEFAFCTTNYLLNGRILEFVIQAINKSQGTHSFDKEVP